MKGGSNILANCFKKTTKNPKDYVPPTAKQENIREGIPIKFPEEVDHTYMVNLLPNILFEEWPSEEEINSFDFTNNGQKYTDINSNLIIFPYSLRKETYSSMVWMRPEEYIKQKNMIAAIKEKYQNKNYNYIKNKLDIAKSNLLNFDIEVNDSEKEEENSENNKNNNEENKDEDNNQKPFFGSIDNMKINIKRRNSIDIAKAEGQNSNFGKEFFNSRLTEEEKKILIENENKKIEFYIVPHEENENNEQMIDNKPQAQKNKNEIQIVYNKLNPSNLNLSVYLCDYCRWLSSQYQILLDNGINTENDKNHFIRKIFPQDKNGVPVYNPSGIYWVKLFHMGKYRKIVIDDKFPVNKETYETFFPQCNSPYELWPMILTKALIKLYSYKYKCEAYEQDEVGDCSILYSLVRYVGIKISSYKFIKYLNNLQDIKNKEIFNENNNNEEEKKIDNILLNNKNNNGYGYDVIIGYISSRLYLEENSGSKKSNIARKNNQMKKLNFNGDIIFPQIERNRNEVLYTERTHKIKDFNINLKNRKKVKSLKKRDLNIPQEYQLLYDRLNKNTGISTRKELDPYQKFERYFEEYRFLTSENIYKNYQKYITKKTNKIHKSGILCDVGYTLLEIFQCGKFNMKRLKPIYFGDMKLDIKVKYKQMTQEEKAVYLDQIKELRKNQKKEKENRINQYLDFGQNILCIKITNESLSNNGKKVYEIDTLYHLREIEAAKLCIKNNFSFPPENYFENTFIPKLTKDEETGEINFWTKNFYHKLLKNYFKVKEEEQRQIFEEQKKLERIKKEEEAKSKGAVYIPSYEEENNDEQKYKDHFLLNEFEEKSALFNNDLNKLLEIIKPGTWMRFENFKDCFDNFILFKSMEEFQNQLVIDNIWYNYDKDIFEEKENSRLIHLIKVDNKSNNNNLENKKNEMNECLNESELYIIFEPNSEKNIKSISSELPYELNEESKKGNKFNDLIYSITLIIYGIDANSKKASQLVSYSMKNYFSILNLNLSKISKNQEMKEYFININGGLCPFGYHIQFLSNSYNIENYSYNQFLCDFKNFTEKKINIMHPILPKGQFFLLKTFILDYKNKDNDTENKIVKCMTNFLGYDDNILKNNIDVVLINSITHKKIKIYYKNLFEIDFSECSKYRVELSIIPPGNIPEKNFDYIVLYDNPNINIEIFENIYPFYIRQKYIPNKHHIVFNELVFPGELINTTLDVALEYRPNSENNIQNNENNNNNYNDENLPKEEPFPKSVKMIFYFMIGEKLIFQKDFENQSLIRNLTLEPKAMNVKDNNASNQLISEAYSIKCVLDMEQCPSWIINPNEYKGDIYWKISVFSTDTLTFLKNTIKEDKEKAVIESWEVNEPGRKVKAEKSRKKYFANIKYNNGEMLSPEEEELIPEKLNSNRKEIIESSSNMLVTNIPPRVGGVQPPSIEEKKQEGEDILNKLPKIKNYQSLFMKNFYLYSNQSRIITKNRNAINSSERCETLPNINQFCKSPEQREQELKDIEEKYNKYYEEMKKEEENIENNKENYETIIQEMNDKFIEERRKLLTSTNEETGASLNKIIKENNIMINKVKEISNFYDELIEEEEITDDIIFDWYNNYKDLYNEINNKEINLNNKYKKMFEEIQKKLGEKIKTRIEIVIKPEEKTKPDIIKKYKDIINQNIILIELNKDNQTLLEKCK